MGSVWIVLIHLDCVLFSASLFHLQRGDHGFPLPDIVTASTNHHQLAAMAASYTLHVTLLAQTRDRTVDSHSPSRFVDSPFLQT